MASFSLKILSCDRLFYQGECDALIYPAEDGGTEILANHTQMTAQVAVGELRYKVPGGADWQIAVVSGVKVDHNEVTVIVYSAEKPEEIDAERARRAKEAAEAELREKQSAIDQRISEDSFNRAVQRIKSAGR